MSVSALKSSLRARLKPSSERYRWTIVVLLLAMLALVRAAFPTERDQYWSARAGLESMAGVALAREDTWSWSADGTWFPNSPAWNVVLGVAWQSFGFWGLFWVGLVSIAAFFGVLLASLRVVRARAMPSLAAIAPLLLALSAALSVRATLVVETLVLGATLFAWWFGTAARSLHSVTSTACVLLIGFVISAGGNWLHLSFMLMAAIIAVMWAVAWWLSPLRASLKIAFIASGTIGLFLGCVLSPYGIGMTLERARIVSAVCEGLIVEWSSVAGAAAQGDWRWVAVGVLAVVVAVGSAIWVVRSIWPRRWSDSRARLVIPLAMVSIPLTIGGVTAIRFLAVGALLLLPVAAAAATAAVDHVHRAVAVSGRRLSRRTREYASGRFWTVVATGVVVVLLPIAGAITLLGAEPAEARVIRELPAGCRLFSDAAAAGPVLLMRPDIEVWIDGRADFYGREHLLEASRIYAAVEPIPNEADCIIAPLGSTFGASMPLVVSLDHDSEWEQVAASRGFGLWVRSGETAGTGARN